jgi:hypothetical protein
MKIKNNLNSDFYNSMLIKIYLMVALLNICHVSHSQSSSNSSGGNIKSIEGTVTYSVGQVFYKDFSVSSGKIAQGVQHPYEIFIISGLEEPGINLKIKTYPNPARDFIILEVDGEVYKNINFQLYDINGRLLFQQAIKENLTEINIMDYNSEVYIIKVNSENKTIKSFKIIKTN